ncbi:hypothetical protein PM082_015009 [Marasmius tenuissimus]|nr:hypothetical protein PM082_015009 [Marasmius tenuissimus]
MSASNSLTLSHMISWGLDSGLSIWVVSKVACPQQQSYWEVDIINHPSSRAIKPRMNPTVMPITLLALSWLEQYMGNQGSA